MGWEAAAQAPSATGPEPFKVSPTASDDLRNFLERLYQNELSEWESKLPRRHDARKLELAQQAALVHAILTLQWWTFSRHQLRFDDPRGFFRDIQSLLFVTAAGELLPRLTAAGMAPEVANLGHGMRAHVDIVWRGNPTHQAFLAGVLAEQTGDLSMARVALETSFITTSPDSHEYLSKAQALWFVMLDQEDYEGARQFLIALYRQAPREYVAELSEMLKDMTEVERRIA